MKFHLITILTLFVQFEVLPQQSLSLNFDNHSNGFEGETTISETNLTYLPGYNDQAAHLDSTTEFRYDTAGNMNAHQGTFKFWVNPQGKWVGFIGNVILSWGGAGGILVQKDGANGIRMIVNQFSINGQPEGDVITSIGPWDTFAWTHVAFTWGNDTMRLFVNGQQMDIQVYPYPFPTINSDNIIFSSPGAPCLCLLDNVCITSQIKTSQEILANYQAELAGEDCEFCENCKPPIQVYELLSPNGDGKNDEFIIDNIHHYSQIELSILNIWGSEVYHNSNYQNDWDGGDLSDGTYYYVVKNTDTGDSQKGRLLLKRTK